MNTKIERPENPGSLLKDRINCMSEIMDLMITKIENLEDQRQTCCGDPANTAVWSFSTFRCDDFDFTGGDEDYWNQFGTKFRVRIPALPSGLKSYDGQAVNFYHKTLAADAWITYAGTTSGTILLENYKWTGVASYEWINIQDSGERPASVDDAFFAISPAVAAYPGSPPNPFPGLTKATAFIAFWAPPQANAYTALRHIGLDLFGKFSPVSSSSWDLTYQRATDASPNLIRLNLPTSIHSINGFNTAAFIFTDTGLEVFINGHQVNITYQIDPTDVDFRFNKFYTAGHHPKITTRASSAILAASIYAEAMTPLKVLALHNYYLNKKYLVDSSADSCAKEYPVEPSSSSSSL